MMANRPTQEQVVEHLRLSVGAVIHSFYRLQSRVHSIRSLSSKRIQVYMKRDDELSFGVSGSKVRKYCSLIPWIVKRGNKKAILIGGAYSNNILGLSQYLIENGVRPIVFLRKPANNLLRGNYLFTRLLVPHEDIRIISRGEWSNVEKIAKEFAREEDVPVIPEGACMKESLPGALSLALDIHRNELELGTEFDHIFVDAGTGLQAIALILGLSYCRSRSQVHVVLLAQSKEEFEARLKEMMLPFETLVGESLCTQLNYRLHRLEQASSFGSVTAGGIDEIVQFARIEGVLLDPIYSGKLVSKTREVLGGGKVKGNILIVHSGGGLSLSGFQPQMESKICNFPPLN